MSHASLVRGLPWRVVAVAGCVAAVLLVARVPASAAAPEPTDRAAIDRFLAAGLVATGVPGMAVAITHGADVVHVAGYGTDGRGRSVTPRTPFRIGSLTKSFTAAAVLQLVESGRVDLDAPVQTYLPGFTTADADVSRRITVRHLLNQTSGIADTPAFRWSLILSRISGGASRACVVPGWWGSRAPSSTTRIRTTRCWPS